jgi:hypothetical protein
MKLLRISVLAAAALLMCETGGKVMAQGGIAPLNQPAYSPYLNLLRGGAPLYQNYYGLVRPEQDFRSALSQLQQPGGLGYPDQAYAPGPANFYVTGHPAVFLNTEGYFPGNGSVANSGIGGIRPNSINTSTGFNFGGLGNSGNYTNLGNPNVSNFSPSLSNYGPNSNLNLNYNIPRPNSYNLPGITY